MYIQAVVEVTSGVIHVHVSTCSSGYRRYIDPSCSSAKVQLLRLATGNDKLKLYRKRYAANQPADSLRDVWLVDSPPGVAVHRCRDHAAPQTEPHHADVLRLYRVSDSHFRLPVPDAASGEHGELQLFLSVLGDHGGQRCAGFYGDPRDLPRRFPSLSRVTRSRVGDLSLGRYRDGGGWFGADGGGLV